MGEDIKNISCPKISSEAKLKTPLLAQKSVSAENKL